MTLVARRTGVRDACPVVTEPFSEWVLAGTFLGGRPRWEDAGARFVEDVTPFEQRKLWLLNGAHSLLAYAGSQRGHHTVAEAIGDDVCAGWVAGWWDEAAPAPRSARAGRAGVPGGPADPVRATSGSTTSWRRSPRTGPQKLPIRVLPVIRAERAAGRVPWAGARVLAAWLLHLRGSGAARQRPGRR